MLYVNFKKPCLVGNSELTDVDVTVRYEAGKVVGLTIMNSSKRQSESHV